jgi:hypothetical protein
MVAAFGSDCTLKVKNLTFDFVALIMWFGVGVGVGVAPAFDQSLANVSVLCSDGGERSQSYRFHRGSLLLMRLVGVSALGLQAMGLLTWWLKVSLALSLRRLEGLRR